MKILILGANGFIGSHLCEAILATTRWQIIAMDLAQHNLSQCLGHENFYFKCGDILLQKAWIAEQVQNCDVIIPLVAIAVPALYVQTPLKIFELDFEANLEIVRLCVRYGKRLIFPSTSEVYGMCEDDQFDEDYSNCITGPIHKERWIYSASKQLLDRIIYAYGKHENLSYTLFRPFNWYGPRLDDVNNVKQGASRVLTQFMGNLLRGENILLVGGGAQQRCFTYIDDGIKCLLNIIENKDSSAHQQIFNIGNPQENVSIKQLAEYLIESVKDNSMFSASKTTQTVCVSAEKYYGVGYQDITMRVPSIKKAQQLLQWEPKVSLQEGLRKTLGDYCLAWS